MVLEWREREHEDMDQDSMRYSVNLQALQRCDLLKLYCTLNMRSQVHLLDTLVSYWDHEIKLFDLQGEALELTKYNIYFITGFYHRGGTVNLEDTRRGGDPLSMQYYVDTYFLHRTQKLRTCVPISQITSFPLKVMVSTVSRVVGSFALHLATQTHMQVAVECMQGTLFY